MFYLEEAGLLNYIEQEKVDSRILQPKLIYREGNAGEWVRFKKSFDQLFTQIQNFESFKFIRSDWKLQYEIRLLFLVDLKYRYDEWFYENIDSYDDALENIDKDETGDYIKQMKLRIVVC